jgi:predicted nuclease of predicted toxin-antitoxin system
VNAVVFKLDENLPREACEPLRARGWDAVTVLDQGMAAARDNELFEVCSREGRVLITLDQDFADIRAYATGKHAGIVILRTPDQGKHAVIRIMHRVADALCPFRECDSRRPLDRGSGSHSHPDLSGGSTVHRPRV